MNCRRIGRLLCLDAGGDLEPRRQSRVAAHLRTCAACRDFRSDLETALAAARSFEYPQSQTVGEELRRAVWREISSERARKEASESSRGRSLVTAAAAATCAALLVSLLLRRSATDSREVVTVRIPSPIASSPLQTQLSMENPRRPSVLSSRAVSSPTRVPSPDAGITRIEFRTRDPQVRVIWLLGRDESDHAPSPLGRT